MCVIRVPNLIDMPSIPTSSTTHNVPRIKHHDIAIAHFIRELSPLRTLARPHDVPRHRSARNP